MNKDELKAFYTTVGERIKAARKEAGIKQETFADLISLSRVSLVNIERGRQRPQAHTLYKIAAELDIDPNKLFPVRPKKTISPEWKERVKKQVQNSVKDKASEKKVLDFIMTKTPHHGIKKN